jgi:hypothetical protein
MRKVLLTPLIVAFIPMCSGQTQQMQKRQHQQQREFSMEKEIVPLRKPLPLPESAAQALKMDGAVSSCAKDENLPNERALASWFVASEIDLGKPDEPDLIVLPAEVFSPQTMQTPPNGCFLGPYTMTFWVLGKVGPGYDVVLRVDAHDLTVLLSKWNGYHEIETSISNMRGSVTTMYRFNGRRYVKYKETIKPPK